MWGRSACSPQREHPFGVGVLPLDMAHTNVKAGAYRIFLRWLCTGCRRNGSLPQKLITPPAKHPSDRGSRIETPFALALLTRPPAILGACPALGGRGRWDREDPGDIQRPAPWLRRGTRPTARTRGGATEPPLPQPSPHVHSRAYDVH